MEHSEIISGKRKRRSYARLREAMDLPNLIEVQRKSYDWFLSEGIYETFNDISPIKDFTENLVMEFVDYNIGEPKYSVEDCKEKDANYSVPLRVKLRLINKESGEVKEQEVFMGDLPKMTENGTFIINGAERVIVSQLVRSPGVYFSSSLDPSGKELFKATIMPNRGAWLEFETDVYDNIYVRVDRTRKIPVTVLLKAIGYENREDILDLFDHDPRMQSIIEKDHTESHEEGLLEIYKKLRPGEPLNKENARSLFRSLFYDPKRYDFASVGRYKANKKLSLKQRIMHQKIAEPLKHPKTGKKVASSKAIVDEKLYEKIEKAGIKKIKIHFKDKECLVRCNEMDEAEKEVFNTKNGEKQKPFYPEEDDKFKALYPEDIVATINYLLNVMDGIGWIDDIDHLGNRRLRSVGELLQNQFRIGLSRMERVIKERMTIQDIEAITPQALINIRPVIAAIKEFFGSSQLSQFMDQTNPLAELTHKRRLSALGPGGLSRERAGFEVRDVHHSHYGRMCPIETPEGPNIGLIGSLSSYARINEYGFIETPYRKVDKKNKRVTNEIKLLTADDEDYYVIAQANAKIDEKGYFESNRVICRYQHEAVMRVPEEIDYIDVSPKQLVSVATALIPFLENDDANRALMGANMQRQGVPLLQSEAPLIGTGMEDKVAGDTWVMVMAKSEGEVVKLTADEIIVKRDDSSDKSDRVINGRTGEVFSVDVSTGNGCDIYKLQKFKRSNQGTCMNQRPVVNVGQKIEVGEVLADGPCTDMGELALGRNVLAAFLPWEGYNFEDAILISERLVKDDVFTSIHIEEYEAEARDTKLGPEEITRDIPNIGDEALRDLDERGIIRIGAEVRAGDILVGKVTPKGETELTAEERLLRAIFGEKAREVRDTSLKVPHGESGIIVDVKVFNREDQDELSPGVNKLVRVYIAQKRKVSEGDKMAGRHGNKGVIARILPEEDMPFLPDGTPLDIVLNPLGVPSRMNIGQVLEAHLGMAAKSLGIHISSPVFDGANEEDAFSALEEAQLNRDGKTTLYDGRTGEPFNERVTVGFIYMLKLAHLVDDKIHARSTGPYSLVTQQPLGGKAQFGGQRFGEMEVWALEAYGAAYTLQEILTLKSDDVVGRVKAYESIVKGENIPEPGVPESFKVLVKELQSLCLDVKVLSEEAQEVEIKEGEEVEYEELEEINIEGTEAEQEGSKGEPIKKRQPLAEDEEEILEEYEEVSESETSEETYSLEGRADKEIKDNSTTGLEGKVEVTESEGSEEISSNLSDMQDKTSEKKGDIE